MLKNFLEVACLSFSFKNFKEYFNTLRLIKGLLVAILFSLFIYLEYFGLKDKLILQIVTSLSTFVAFYFILSADKQTLFWIGTFIGGLWFYWVSFSLRYFDLYLLIPLVIMIFAFGYGVFFLALGCLKKSYLKALAFLGFSFFHPFEFDWFVPELSLVDSFFDFTKLKFALFLASISILIELKSYYKLLFIPLLLLSIRYETPHTPLSKQKIFLAKRDIPQDKKWKESYFDTLISDNFKVINKAIKNNYDMVVLSESVFPYYLNTDPIMTKKLQDLSHKITIVTGSLYTDGQKIYNSAYYFIDGNFYVANKVVLVPFSETIPLPKVVANLINKIFFKGAEDFSTASKPTDIIINKEVFRNAICYEATSKILHENSPNFMIAISNNAWFTPSIEPTLQRLLLRYYSRLYHNTIYHSANSGGTGVVRFVED